MKQLKLSLVVLTLLCFTASEAQVGSYFSKFRPGKKWSVGLQISPTFLNGDLDDPKLGLSGGAHLKYSISQTFGLKLSGSIGQLKAVSDENYEVNNNFHCTPSLVLVLFGVMLKEDLLNQKMQEHFMLSLETKQSLSQVLMLVVMRLQMSMT